MIFMSQSGLLDLDREAEWDDWYLDHLTKMMTVPAVFSAQRFRSESPGHPRSLAVYTMLSEEVFADPVYLAVRGMGDWSPLIDRNQYRRNLFDGLAEAPPVGATEVLIVADRPAPDTSLPIPDMAWLRAVAVDKSTPYRGIAVVARADLDRMGEIAGLGTYLPATEPLRKPAEPNQA